MTLEESIRIYARASRAWFGGNAGEKTRERIQSLERIGDFEGVRVYEMVEREILLLEREALSQEAF